MGERLATTAVPADEWLYYRIHVDAADAGDRLLREVVSPVIGQLSAGLPEDSRFRWFFLRFADPSGLHIRLRLNASRHSLGEVERTLDAALSAAARQETPICDSYRKYLYAPEGWKFGAGAGIRHAEELFQAGSEMALEVLAEPGPASRVDYGAAHLLMMVGALPPAQQASFLHQYAWYWSGGPTRRPGMAPRGGPLHRDRSAGELERLLAGARRALDAPAGGLALLRYGHRVRKAMRASGRSPIPRSDYFLLFHHLHLTNNRIGVFPAAESALARMLWLAMRRGIVQPSTPDMTHVMPNA
ncbi:thiopeptide-type bacteriocin biosynthesis protein [Streptacidiphilus jiangxiensis]|uniref:Thiopeptide-type bacteriocin biosynthesis domain-containing protein n=1 Tax=Streptacidiphilus jiangxiensis TaxID=235985 RepID=A0A1H7KRH1_STRJI|nr:thiopeptide-type bacteriocin biosynthesis protein [Streptacidiphilus jiangxiensis]SEK89348.1 thiopeptide-type bacteriocin biosynthesis domain-containing protein [Streptacidiphilus jiangxiensis]